MQWLTGSWIADRGSCKIVVRIIARALLVCAIGACSGERKPADDVTIYVENGVTIVENPGVHLADSLAWSIDTTDVVRIGMLEGPDEYVIGRLAGTLLLSDGSILVADATAHELRVFDARGTFVRKVGRKGEGPGEFNWLTSILPYAADSFVVMDHESSRGNVLDPSFGYVRRFRPRLLETRARPPMTSHSLVGFFGDGRSLVSDYLNVCGDSRHEGFCEDSAAFFRTDETGSTIARYGRFVYGRHEGTMVGPGHATGWYEPHPQSMWAVHGDRFYYADAKRFEVLVFKSDGALDRRIRVAGTTPRYDMADVWPAPESPQPARSPDIERGQRALREAQAKAAMPDTFPAFSDLLVDASGNIWVREYLPLAHIRQTRPRWFVFDPEGRLRWSLRSPAGMIRYFRPYLHMSPQITEDRVLASVRDADGVESVVVYPLTRDSHAR